MPGLNNQDRGNHLPLLCQAQGSLFDWVDLAVKRFVFSLISGQRHGSMASFIYPQGLEFFYLGSDNRLT